MQTDGMYPPVVGLYPPTDERGGWTSASSAEFDALCPGRHLAQKGLPEAEESQEAAAGTRIHAWLAGDRKTPLADEQEQQTAEMCARAEEALVDRVFGGRKPDVIKREVREWMAVSGGYHHSGKPDVVYVLDDAALIIDYKTGRNDVAESPTNLQLRDLAVLACCAPDLDVTKVSVAIIQPWVTMTPEVCEYDDNALNQSKFLLHRRVVASNSPDSPRIPGEKQCRYCRAKATCPEFLAVSLPAPLNADKPAIVSETIRSLSAEKMRPLLDLAEMVVEVGKEEVRARLTAGTAVPGFELKPGRITEKITNPTEVFNRCINAGVSDGKFVSDCVTVSKTSLKSVIKEATGLRGAELDAKVSEIVGGCTETTTSQPVLARVK